MPATYSTGTISVGSNSTAVSGLTTAWITGGVREGDLLFANGLMAAIGSVNTASSITLVNGWPGAAISGGNYTILKIDDGLRALEAYNQLLQSITDGTLYAFADLVGAADRLAYFNGQNSMALTAFTSFGRSMLDDPDAATARNTLGLGTAATQTVTTSATDATAGRLLKVGDFGIGVGSGPGTTAIASALYHGFYRHSGSDPDAPFATGREGAMLVLRTGGARLRQIAFEGSSDQQAYERFSADDGVTWTAWRRLRPERGSNANGEYVRFPDGTQICWHTLTSSASASTTWTFPAQFSVAPKVFVDPYIASAALASGVRDVFQGGTSVGFSSVGGSGRRADSCDLIAIGRWF